MGVDINDVRTVVHLAPPASVEAYLQETGRASRDGKGAEAWLIVTPEDVLKLGDPRGGSRKDEGAGRSGQAAPAGDSGGPANQVGEEVSPALPSKASRPDSTPSAEEYPSTSDAAIAPHDAESVAAARRNAIIHYAASTGRCRREMLLEALGIEAQDCTSCDVCGGEAWTDPPEMELILKVVRWNRGQFRKGQLARILIGRRTAEIRRVGLDMVRGFGVLTGWELEDAEEAICGLVGLSVLRRSRFGRSQRMRCR